MGRGKDQELLDAARSGDIKAVGKLLELAVKRHGPLSSFRRSPSINCQDMNGYTPLHHACLNGHSNIVHLLLAHNAKLDIPDIRGSTALYLAAWAGHHDIVKMLLVHTPDSADPNAQTIENETPLHSAAQHGHNSVVAILLAYGADPSIRNNSFQTSLDLASQFGRLQVVQILLRAHPELILPYRTVDTHSSDGYPTSQLTSPKNHIFTHTCLHLASRNGHRKVVDTLLAAGVDVNIHTHAGTALHEAALCGKKSVVTTLLKAGVDVDAIDGNGRTALDILNNYPPHVTYDIVTVINEFCNSSELYFNPINYERHSSTGTDVKIIENVHHVPKRLFEKYVVFKPKNARLEFISNGWNKQLQNGLSNSLSSLDRYAPTPDCYLKMKPIKWQKSTTDLETATRTEIPNSYEPVYKQPYQGAFMQTRKRNDFNGATIPSRSIEYINLIKPNSSINENQSNDKGSDATNAFYRCIDQYVEMSEPSSTAPQSRLHLVDKGDYANIEKLTTNLDDIVQTTTSIDSNNNQHNSSRSRSISKTHSPTPDYPPPTVTEAEHSILEYMQPLTSKNKEPSLKMKQQEHAETFDTPRTSSVNSDNVEQFVGDVPFAGLFKGSTLNLAQDELDGNNMVAAREALRSPSLVRAATPLVRRSLLKQRNSTIGEDFSASRVWAEIDTIFESIGNEVQDAERQTEESKKLIINNSEEEERDLSLVDGTNGRQPLHIRKPDELFLGASNSPTTTWCHSPHELIYDEIRYTVFYLGSTVIRQLQGIASTRKSIQKLKIDENLSNDSANLLEKCNTSTKYLKAANLKTRLEVGIAVSHAGVKFIDLERNSTICIHDIENISCVCQDAEELRYFAYITKEHDLHYCHVFMVDNLELATEIILTVGLAFEVAYQLALTKCTLSEDCEPEQPGKELLIR